MPAVLPHDRARRALAPLALALALAVAGCGGDRGTEDEAGSATGSGTNASAEGPRTLQPGRPGEEATEVSPDLELPDNEWNHTDVAFVQMMIPHHRQALEMSQLAAKHASDPAVRRFAERIEAAQAPEILMMSTWLEERDLEVPAAGEDWRMYDHGRHGHHSMMGMMTPKQMEQLADARGTRFDRLFLQGMIRHHEGAVRMAEDAAPEVGDVLINELVADVGSSQAAEINRMRDLLADL